MRKEGKVNLLLIHDVDPTDTGTYTCDTGDVQSSAKLAVTGDQGLRDVTNINCLIQIVKFIKITIFSNHVLSIASSFRASSILPGRVTKC